MNLTDKHLTDREEPARWRAGALVASAVVAAGLSWVAPQASAAESPLILEKCIMIPGVPVGPYSDALDIDLAGGRLFATPQAAKAVAVLDLKDGRVLKMMPVGNPHGLFYSPTLKRLFVTDGASGDVKVFGSEDYSLIKTIPLKVGADGLVYDSPSQFIYVNNGGEDAGMDHSLISAIDTVRMQKVADISVATRSLEGGDVDSAKQLLYVNLDKADHGVAVVDLKKRQTVATWKIPAGAHRAKAVALDSAHGRLYVASRDTSLHGSVFVFDTTTGRLVATLPIGGWADGIFVDPKRQRFYVTTGVGYVETYTVGGNDVYRREAPVETAVLAKTGLYSSELDRMYVSVPHLGDDGSAQVMVFRPAP